MQRVTWAKPAVGEFSHRTRRFRGRGHLLVEVDPHPLFIDPGFAWSPLVRLLTTLRR